ncbi:nucleoside recognition domain-containing protein [Paenibacillus sp.]|jgi:sporulation integral membrane protein YlbJ|uniref:nucleoside recognition domain-containing protein n=1 Tax=Paenibacillus sp. TaxID=58172 RepID=UPI002838F106|nr:nucleoside recognition domain-containing protein [Paenibacillus sp.]MDR0269157.1 nucleoside recognition protein [Paenibacillus sp.]
MKKKAPSRFTPVAATVLLGAGAIVLVTAIVSSPAPAFQASLQGLRLWWQIVFPALLPFLVLSEMLIAYGWIHALGTWLEPLMNRLFKLPGIGGWVLAMGMTTGFPGGAQAARQLYEQGDLNAREADKLAALAHFCNPMLILIVIATGLMHDPAAGYILLVVHWITGLSAFLLLGRSRKHSDVETARNTSVKKSRDTKSPSLVYHSLESAKRAHAKDGRSFGRLLGDSVTNAVQSLMMVGGYIIIFAVVIQIASRVMPGRIPAYWLSGLLEVHLGAKDAAAATFASDRMQWSVISALLGFSGISAILQSMSALGKAGIRRLHFTLVRLLHGVLAFAATWVIWPLIRYLPRDVSLVFSSREELQTDLSSLFSLWKTIPQLLQWQVILVATMLACSLMLMLLQIRRKHSR